MGVVVGSDVMLLLLGLVLSVVCCDLHIPTGVAVSAEDMEGPRVVNGVPA